MQTGETRGTIKVRKALLGSHEFKIKGKEAGNHTCHYEGRCLKGGRTVDALNEGFRPWMASHANSSESKEP